VTVKLTNGTKKSLDLALANVTLRTGKEGNSAQNVADVENGIESGLTGTLAADKTATAKYGFSVARTDLDQVVVEVIPGFLIYEPVLFEGPVGFR
jgi:hypothetical protein